MPVTPPAPRHSVQDLGDRLHISIPAPRHWWPLIALPFWLVFWIFGVLEVLSPEKPPNNGALIWLSIWTIGGIIALGNVLWMVSGKEVIEVSNRSIVRRRQIVGIAFPKEYLADHIEALRVLETVAYPYVSGQSRSFGGQTLSDGSLAFDYGTKTIRIAEGIDEAEAKQILAAIQQRFPQYRLRVTISQ